ncbi:hypothetical protein [Nocardioides luteus]|uniref:hypothetical protein n=1 Tax=Nocardioides luteus TaxID=1844 RepID=UPI00115FE252|nr:hypothetical protein [Nocardioides luteus]
MGSERGRSAELSAPADMVFRAALGIAQNDETCEVKAVHNEGHALILWRRTKALSWPKLIMIRAVENGSESSVNVAVQSLPEGAGGLIDGRRNSKLVDEYIRGIEDVLSGTTSAPARAVVSHYVRDDGTEVPWDDPDEFPDF